MAAQRDAMLDIDTDSDPSDSADWCSGNDQTAADTWQTYVDVLSDPYSPNTNQNNWSGNMSPKNGDTGPFCLPDGTCRAGSADPSNEQVTSVQYSIDGSSWNNEPPLNRKNWGFSELPDPAGWINYGADSPALSFVPIVTPTDSVQFGKIKAMMSAYDPAINPTGLRVPDFWSNQNTPLYGTLQGAAWYLQKKFFDSDVDLSCRRYAVILVTDGFEEQPTNNLTGQYRGVNFDQWSQTDLQNAVTNLKNLKNSSNSTAPLGGVQTYVVGFGDGLGGTGPTTLDLMARAAGTAVPDNVTGTAYAATSPATLRATLTGVFSNLVSGYFTKSKPVLSQTGTATYFGFFYDSATPYVEKKGFLNKYDTAQLNELVTPPPVWQFDQGLNTQPTATRHVYVPLSNGYVTDIAQGFSTAGTWKATTAVGNQAAFESDTGIGVGTAPTLVNFVLNPLLSAPYAIPAVPVRESRLGEVYHSIPAAVGGKPPQPPAWAGSAAGDQTGYTAFQTLYTNRDVRVMIGANDGMLHSICEINPADMTADGGPGASCPAGNDPGSETWAFIPPSLLPKLNSTRSPGGYGPMMVDGSFGVADVCTATDCTVPGGWMTLMLAGLREGGNSIFALNVTNMTTPTFLWEMTDTAMGESWSPPTVAKVIAPGALGERWVALMGGGVGASSPQGDSILMVDVKTGAVLTDGTNSARWSGLGQSCCGLPKDNVPGRVAVVRKSGADPYIQQAYVGDTQGRLFRIDPGDDPTNINNWAPSAFFDPATRHCRKDSNGNGVQIFMADSETTADTTTVTNVAGSPDSQLPLGGSGGNPTKRNPIYQRPLIAKDKNNAINVFFGTGDVPNADMASPNPDFFYAVLDNNTIGQNTPCGGGSNNSTNSNDNTYQLGGEPIWVKQFPAGYKMVSEGVVAGSTVFVPAFRPATGCTSKGDTIIYAFDTATGNAVKAFSPAPGGTLPRYKVTESGAGVPSDLSFVPGGGNTGSIIWGDQGSTGGAIHKTSVSFKSLVWTIRGFKRVR
jgi:Tfp pilus tip-associated adhesin PilY1